MNMAGDEHRQWFFLFARGRNVTDLPYDELRALVRKLTPAQIDSGSETAHGFAVCFDRDVSHEVIEQIVGASGYILSAGHILLFECWEDVTEDRLATVVREAARSNDDDPRPDRIHLLALTHEGFPERWPFHTEGELATRFYREKAHLGEQPIPVVFKRIRSGTPPWGDVRVELIDRRDQLPRVVRTASSISLFLLQDVEKESSPSGTPGLRHYPGERDKHLLILLDRCVQSGNLVHRVDDHKPFWPERHTTPPRLAAAALNVSRLPFARPKASTTPVVVDPFAGTGTMVLEALKYPCETLAGDREQPTDIEFNLDFFLTWPESQYVRFSNSVHEHLLDGHSCILRHLCHALSVLYGGGERLRAGDGEVSPTLGTLAESLLVLSPSIPAKWCHVFSAGSNQAHSATSLLDALHELHGYRCSRDVSDLELRFLTYLVFRVVKSSYADVTDDLHYLDVGLVREHIRRYWEAPQSPGHEASAPLSRMVAAAAEEARLRHVETTPSGVRRSSDFGFRPSILYSPTTWDWRSVAQILHYDLLDEPRVLHEALENAGGFDLLVTDLPYSFNTRHTGIESLYDSFCALVDHHGRHGSELVLLTLAKVKTGQSVPEACLSKNIAKRIEANSSYRLNGEWYWRSAKALDRRILRFRSRT